MSFKKATALLLTLLTFSHSLRAQSFDERPAIPDPKTKLNFDFLGEDFKARTGEFTAGYYPGATMIPVSLWGATKTTGLFHVPRNTTLMALITYAHGPADNAKLYNIIVKRTAEKKDKVITVDLEKVLASPGLTDIPLMPYDTVYVEPRKAFDTRWVIILGTVATLLTATLAGITISDRLRHRN